MFVVLCSRFDSEARRLVEDWPGEARLLTPADLSVRGWRHVCGAADNTAVIGGCTVATSEIDGVLTRLPAVLERELGFIAAADRGYVAAEMTAWLTAWLSELPCPVLNRPSPVYLMGPSWSREQWLHVARRLGIPVVTARRSTGFDGAGSLGDREQPCAVVTVAAGRAVGAGGDALAEAAVALAEAAGVELLRARFASDGPDAPLLGADYWVDLEHPDVRAAILARLAEAAAPARPAGSSAS